MTHVSRIRLEAPPEAVWPWVAHPEDDERGGPTRALPTRPGRSSRGDRERWMSELGRLVEARG